MPRRGENIYKRKDGRWEGRILQDNGKYQYFYGKSYKEVKEKKKTLIANLDEPVRKRTGEVCKASQLFELWLNGNVKNRLRPSTFESYYICIKNYVIPFFQKSRKDSITEFSVNEFLKKMYTDQALADSYKNKIITVFKIALKEVMAGSPSYQQILPIVKQVKTEDPVIQIFTVKEQRKIEAELFLNQDDKTIGILLCFYTGIRLGELCALRWEDLDLEECIMSIERTVSRIKSFNGEGRKTKLVVGPPKSNSSKRKIPIPNFLIQFLIDLKIHSRDYGKNGGKYIFSDFDIPIDPRTFQKKLKKILACAGVTDRKFHTIRHTFATRALESGIDIKTLSEILGHSSVLITLKVYAHSLMEQKIAAMNKLNLMYVSGVNNHLCAVNEAVRNE